MKKRIRLKNKYSTTLLFSLLCSISASATTNVYYDKAKEGWFYYHDPKIKKVTKDRNITKHPPKPIERKQEKEKSDNPVDKMLNGEYTENREEKKRREQEFMRMIPLDSLDKLGADEYRDIENKAREISIMTPTKENLNIYLALNKFQTDQAQRFAKVWLITQLESPELKTSNQPFSKFAIDAKRVKEDKKVKKFYEDKKDRLAYVVFYKDDGNSLQKQKVVYRALERDFGVTVEYIPTDNYYKDRFKLIDEIENFFVYRSSDNSAVWRRIKSGMISLDDIVETTQFLFENTIKERKKAQ